MLRAGSTPHTTVPADINNGSVPMSDALASSDAERGVPASARNSRRKKLNVDEPKPTKRAPRASTRKSTSAFCSELSAARGRRALPAGPALQGDRSRAPSEAHAAAACASFGRRWKRRGSTAQGRCGQVELLVVHLAAQARLRERLDDVCHLCARPRCAVGAGNMMPAHRAPRALLPPQHAGRAQPGTHVPQQGARRGALGAVTTPRFTANTQLAHSTACMKCGNPCIRMHSATRRHAGWVSACSCVWTAACLGSRHR